MSTRRAEHDRRHGNHVSTWIVPLPVAVEDPMERLDTIRQTTQNLKSSGAAHGVDTLMQLAEWLPAPLIGGAARLAGSTANMIVTNVPGPQFPLYMLGSRMLGLYPLVPLLPGGGLGGALFSYEGKLCWGFNGDYELVPDLSSFVDDVRAAFEELRAAAVSRFMADRTAAPEVPEPVAKPKPTAALARVERVSGGASRRTSSSDRKAAGAPSLRAARRRDRDPDLPAGP